MRLDWRTRRIPVGRLRALLLQKEVGVAAVLPRAGKPYAVGPPLAGVVERHYS